MCALSNILEKCKFFSLEKGAGRVQVEIEAGPRGHVLIKVHGWTALVFSG